ncbi:MAG TPA: hypothetical protein VK588_13295 [Chitinophagaceae bacterium]|nr:hypothetical protein [Chitinophagaceae bacterium]
MSSKINKIREFFEKHISALHKHTEKGECSCLDLKFDKNTDSYFTKPINPQYLYLNTISLENEEKLKDYLNEFWKDQPSLMNLIPDLVKLAFILKEDCKEQSAELSPFIYAMF